LLIEDGLLFNDGLFNGGKIGIDFRDVSPDWKTLIEEVSHELELCEPSPLFDQALR